jgi:thiol-disulfide isomerase/thioredoxin
MKMKKERIKSQVMTFMLLMALLGNPCYSEVQNKKLPSFSLTGVNGKVYTDSDFKDKKLLALVFLSNHCKVSQLFQGHLIELSQKFANNTIILAVSPNYEDAILPDELAYSDFGDSFDDMRKRSVRMKYNFPYLHDGDKQRLTQAIGVKITPTVYLYNEKRELCYAGRIGNVDSPDKMESSDLYEAIERGLREKDMPFKRTKVFGTSIKTKEHLLLAEQVRERYANESIKLSQADDRKLEFYLRHKTKKPKLFYVWQTNDKNTRDNLMKLSFLYKIFRKRGLRLITVCIAKKDERNVIVELLQNSQLSSTNFLAYGHQVAPLSIIAPPELEKVTPYYRLLGSDGKMLMGNQGEISTDTLRFEILRALDDGH